MALPASGPISGSQIATEVDVETFNISLSGMYNTSSLTTKSTNFAYSNFYGYAHVTLTAFTVTSTTAKFSDDVCNIATSITYYHDGDFDTPGNGNIVYTDSAGTTFAQWTAFKGFGGTVGDSFSAGRVYTGTGVVYSAVLCF